MMWEFRDSQRAVRTVAADQTCAFGSCPSSGGENRQRFAKRTQSFEFFRSIPSPSIAKRGSRRRQCRVIDLKSGDPAQGGHSWRRRSSAAWSRLSDPRVHRRWRRRGGYVLRSDTYGKGPDPLRRLGRCTELHYGEIEFVDENGGGPGVRLRKPLKQKR